MGGARRPDAKEDGARFGADRVYAGLGSGGFLLDERLGDGAGELDTVPAGSSAQVKSCMLKASSRVEKNDTATSSRVGNVVWVSAWNSTMSYASSVG